MPFLRGSLRFERYNVSGFDTQEFGESHIEILQKYAAGKTQTSASENIHVGFLGGSHLFDQDFDLSKNLINNAVHFSARIDTNVIPSAIRAAWLQMELAGYAKENDSGIPTKSQRKEAKEAVEQRCEVEAASGKFRRMQQFPILWDLNQSTLYFGGSVGASCGHCLELVQQSFDIELNHLSAGTIAQAWAVGASKYAELDDLLPVDFISNQSHAGYAWTNEHSNAPDFLGNEFLMWLWWTLENESDTIVLADQSEVTVMLNKSLSLECPTGDSGKESITADGPTQLPEAIQAVRAGKLPRKSGMTLVRDGRQFDLVLQAETLGISGAKIHLIEDEEFGDDERIDAIRLLSETTDLMFQGYCEHRTSHQWAKTQNQIQQWLLTAEINKKMVAA